MPLSLRLGFIYGCNVNYVCLREHGGFMKKNRGLRSGLKINMQWPLFMCIPIALFAFGMYYIDIKSGVFATIFFIIYLGVSILFYCLRNKYIRNELILYAMDYAQIQKVLIDELDIPFGLVDDKGKLLWVNSVFTDIIGRHNTKKKISDIFEEAENKKLFPCKGQNSIEIEYDDHYYKLLIKPVNINNNVLEKSGRFTNLVLDDCLMSSVYLMDETDVIFYKNQVENEKPVMGLVYIDNYDEALESIEDVRRSLLAALIDRKISRYISSVEGVVKKFEKDKYIVTLKQEQLLKMMETKFGLLEEVKAVNIGNEQPITLSMGFGINGAGCSDSYAFARSAIDMALARGGDQAVVRDNDNISYFGGKLQQQEKNTRVKARVKAQALRDLMENKDRVIIMGHKNGDIDCFGAAIGIFRAAMALERHAHIVIDDITPTVKLMAERFLNTHEYPEDLIINSEKALSLCDGNTMLVVVDTNRASYMECPELLERVQTIVVLDHHRQMKDSITNAVLSYVEPYASSACEMVAEILQYIDSSVKIRPVEADAMYAGIVVDTNNFVDKTGVRTFEAAAFLRRNGADVTRVRKLFRDDINDYKARAEAVSNAEIFMDSYAISICDGENSENPVVGAQAANELLNIIGVKASVVVSKHQDVIYLSARSIDEVNVQLIMERLGGGGHLSSAGAQLKDCTVEEAIQLLKDTIVDMTEKGEI